MAVRRNDDDARRRRRAADTARWRSRIARCVKLFPIEIGPTELDFAIRFGGLNPARTSDRSAVTVAFERLLRMAIAALEREQSRTAIKK